jgi:hypothetical protein
MFARSYSVMCAGFHQLILFRMPSDAEARDTLVEKINNLKRDSIAATRHIFQIIHARTGAEAATTTDHTRHTRGAYSQHADVGSFFCFVLAIRRFMPSCVTRG